MTINAPAAILLAMYVVAAGKRGVPLAGLSGTTQNDVLKEYVARGTYIFPPRHALRLAAELIAYSARELPKWNPISVSGYHMRDAGATAVEEMAFAVSNGIAYVDATRAFGIAVDAFAPRISWIFNTHNHFFEEVAKYRALRRLWARTLRDRFGARDPRSWQLRTHSQTGGATLTLQQPDNNVVRAAFQAMAAVLGGVQSLALSCRDEAISIPTEASQEIALRTQQILAHETGVADVADPLGGSYYVEALTDELERRARVLIGEIDAMGGAVAAIESGYMQRAIDDEAYRHQCEVESGARVVVGVNVFRRPELEDRLARFPLDPVAEPAQREALRALRAGRDNAAVQRALADLRAATERGDAQIPLIIAAVRAYATTGEITDSIATIWGRYRP
jgi:methylmalonyl-CoA mutase N-terminal domain/subunit